MQIAETIVLRPVAALIPYARNPRTHSPEQISQIAASIREFGFTNPVLVDEAGGIIAGHGRVLAAAMVGMETVPTIELGYLTETQRQAYVIADNKLALNAGWDEELLRTELEDLLGRGYDLSLTGFGEVELSELLGERCGGKTDPDEVPEVPEHPVSRMGDLWVLGRHRLLCGDAMNADNIGRVVNGDEIDLCLTDPPYANGEAYATHHDDVVELAKLVEGALPRIRKVARCVLLTPGIANQHRYPPPDWTLAWFVPAGSGRVPWGFGCWQPILAYGKDPFLAKRRGARPDALCLTEAADNSLGHPCPKPIKVWSWVMERGSVSPGEKIFDPFVGSGTTMIAAEMTGRACLAIEIAPAYVDVAVARWQDFTGEAAVLDGDGRTFAAIADAREDRAPSSARARPAPSALRARERAAG